MNPESFRRLDADFNGNALAGTGIDEDVLRRGGVGGADAFAAVTDDDNTNIMASQIAKAVFGVKKVVTRLYDSTREDTYLALGLETVCPTCLGATRIKELLRRQQ
jgi:trk system potassium uptake protein TrkA